MKLSMLWMTLILFGLAEEGDAPVPDELVVVPAELALKIGEKASLAATVKDKKGETLERKVIYFSRGRRMAGVNPAGEVTAHAPGEATIIAMVPVDPERSDDDAEPLLSFEVKVTVAKPPIAQVNIGPMAEHFYAGTRILLTAQAVDQSGASRPEIELSFSSKNPKVARSQGSGHFQLLSEGKATIVVQAGSEKTKATIRVRANPVVSLELTPETESVRTGDVARFQAVAKNAQGAAVPDVPVMYSLQSRPYQTILGAGAAAQIEADGRFVAERSGSYTVVATTGSHTAWSTIAVTPRKMSKKVEVVGRGKVADQHTSDLWVWESQSGRDFAITGTWGADGHAKFWDVTNPESISLVDTVRVDARTVNDVKVSEDGKLAVISREGASNRKNGFVILDVSEPHLGVRIIGTYDDQLHGGVHNIFIAKNHVYALSDGRFYDIINIEDPAKPYRVGRFELDTPGHGIHDVWVTDGIAYSSNWSDGVVAVDVGGGGKGGSEKNPVELGRYAYPSGWNHAAFPYRSKSTGKFYVFAGDEAFPTGLHVEPDGPPTQPDGWIHVIEWDDWSQPREVARYRVPEAGSHNFWIEDDILYVGYYNGGLRVVDVSGELMGDLYRQGREIASFRSFAPDGYLKNAPFVWGPQPFKGHIYFSDWNSGLWAVKLVDWEKPIETGEPQ